MIGRSANGSSLPVSMMSIFRTARGRATEKTPIIYHVSNPAWKQKMDLVEEKIIQEDGLDRLSEDELIDTLVKSEKHYAGSDLVSRVEKTSRELGMENAAPEAPERVQKAKVEQDAEIVQGPEAQD